MSATRRQAAPEFRPNEFLEALVRLRDEQPRRYEREIAAGQRRRVQLYAEAKARAAAQGSAVGKARAA